MEAVITFGNDRLWTVMTGTRKTIAANLERFKSINVSYLHFQEDSETLRRLIEKLRSDPAQFRVKNGEIEARPVSWVQVVGDATSDSTILEACYSSEVPETHTLTVNQQQFDLGSNPRAEFRFDPGTNLVLSVGSEVHYAREIDVHIPEG